MIQQIKIVLHPSLVFRFHLFESVEFYLIFSTVDILNLQIVFLGEFMPPDFVPGEVEIANQTELIRICFNP